MTKPKIYFKTRPHKLTNTFKNLRKGSPSRKPMTLAEIGKKYGYSYEGVRQISDGFKTIDWDKTIAEGYGKEIKDKSLAEIIIDIEPLTVRDRTLPFVLKREVVIVELRDRFHLPFTQIAKLMKRDHTSIMNLYYKNHDKREQSRQSTPAQGGDTSQRES